MDRGRVLTGSRELPDDIRAWGLWYYTLLSIGSADAEVAVEAQYDQILQSLEPMPAK